MFFYRNHSCFFSFFVLLLIQLFCIGCGNFQRLGGTVVYSDDETPVADCQVVFTDGVYNSRGTTNEKGEYTVTSMKPGDGIPRGEYKVYIGGAEIIETKFIDGTEHTTSISLIDGKYRSPETSGLTFTADGKTRRFDIKLDRAGSAKRN